MDKKSVQRSFSRAAPKYDGSSTVQKDVAVELTRLVASLNEAGNGAGDGTDDGPGKNILDIGCGTGSLTRLLKDLYPGSKVTGCDIAAPMLHKARELSGSNGAGLFAADCEGLALREGAFDLAASSLTFQWSPDTRLAFGEARRVLKPGGLFAFSTLGPATLHELKASYEEVISRRGHEYAPFLPYKDPVTLTDELKATGLRVTYMEARPIIRTYKDLFELLTVLKNIGAFRRVGAARGANDGGLAGGLLLKEVAGVYREKFPGPPASPASKGAGVRATYDVIYAAARKVS
jgi:malonyl-CoA O-methyltransferase